MIQFFKGVNEKPFGNIHSMPHPRSFLSLLRLLSVKGHFISVPLLGLNSFGAQRHLHEIFVRLSISYEGHQDDV